MRAGDRMFKTRRTRDCCPAGALTVDASASLPAAPERLAGLRMSVPVLAVLTRAMSPESPQCAKKGKTC